MSRKFHKTVFQIEVLSEDPYPEGRSLVDIAYDITEGECSGRVHRVSSEELDGRAMANALIEQDSDPEFFGLDQDGNKIDDNEDDGEPNFVTAVINEMEQQGDVFYTNFLMTLMPPRERLSDDDGEETPAGSGGKKAERRQFRGPGC